MNPAGIDSVAWLDLEDGSRLALGNSTLLGLEVKPGDGHCLPYPTVSKRHALVTSQDGGEYWLLDCGSTNGTYVNTQRLVGARRLRDADRVWLGQSVKMVFRQPLSPEARHAATVAGGTIAETWSEHRWLLMIDLVQSTKLSQSLPVLELPRVIGTWLAQCRDLVQESGGSVNKYMGDGVLAFWHDGEEAAARVGQAVRKLCAWQQSPPPFRFALHRGEIVIGGGPSMGEESLYSPDLSYLARLEEVAKKKELPDLISAAAAEGLRHLLPLVAHGETLPLRGHLEEAVVYTVGRERLERVDR